MRNWPKEEEGHQRKAFFQNFLQIFIFSNFFVNGKPKIYFCGKKRRSNEKNVFSPKIVLFFSEKLSLAMSPPFVANVKTLL